MSDPVSQFAEHLDRDCTTLCHCWLLERRDGVRFGFTDHDGPLSFDGQSYEPETGFTQTEMRETLGMAVDSTDGLVRGVWLSVYGAEPEQPGSYAPDWAECASGEPLLEAARRHCAEIPVGEARAGDLIVFRWRARHRAKHLGILVDDHAFVHAYEGHRVMVSALVPQWRTRIAGAFAFPPRDADPRR